jgi:hypothetical protein
MGAASGRVTFPMLGPISASKTALESIADDERAALADMLTRVMEPYWAGRQEPPRRRSR